MRRPTWSAGLTIVALAATAACAGSGAGASRPPSLPPEVKQRLTSPGPTPDRQDRADFYRQKNEIMARCMKDAGFEYIPYTPPPTVKDSLGLSDEEFVRRYGFGISTLIDRQPPAPRRGADPNLDVVAKLSGSQRDAYLGADAGCEQQVFRQLGPPVGGGPVSGPADDPLQNLIADAAAKAEADPRIAAAKQRYQTCMAGRGFPAISGDGLTGEISDRAAPFAEAYRARVAQVRARGQDPARVNVSEALSPQQQAALTKLQRYELAAAAADYECGKLLYPVVDQVHREYLAEALDGR